MLTVKKLSAHPTDEPHKTILHEVSVTFEQEKTYVVMGPNGSGKSTLARTIMGDPAFVLSQNTKITLAEEDITELSADKRAGKGIFLSQQSPIDIPGVTVYSILRAALKDSGMSARDIKEKVDATAQELKIPAELLKRSLNEGLSGGERKKMEVLQMAVLDPDYIFLDEIDTGVDVDAMKTIGEFLKNFVEGTNKTLVIITHYNRILEYLTPDDTIVIKAGKIAATGNADLAAKIEENGFDQI